jgi:hypothetical protein
MRVMIGSETLGGGWGSPVECGIALNGGWHGQLALQLPVVWAWFWRLPRASLKLLAHATRAEGVNLAPWFGR